MEHSKSGEEVIETKFCYIESDSIKSGAPLYTVNDGRQKLFFSSRICYKLCSKSQLKELHMVKLLHIKIIDNAGRIKTKLLPIDFIDTSHNSANNIKVRSGKSS